MKNVHLILCALWLLFGCADEEPETIELQDEGAVCITQTTQVLAENSIVADEPTRITVLFENCSTTCIEDLETACSVDFDSQTSTLTVTSMASWTLQDVDQCNTACLVIEASCEGPTLPEGTYTIVHGESEESLTVPSTYQCESFIP